MLASSQSSDGIAAPIASGAQIPANPGVSPATLVETFH
jgi:hypothetical protein